ncbi:MAG TPA: ThuA domain-containing protein [Micromonosporaceae bacterium]|nr:ThuA domain-containing protein [Micromonosporaceae bacterium]
MSFDVLVFSKTTGFRHESIETGVAAIRRLGATHGFEVAATEDSAEFTAALPRHQAVIFLSTSGELFDDAQRAALEAYIRGGGGFVGVHSASTSEVDWPFYGALVGAYFDWHPEITQATVLVEDADHPATAHLPKAWTRTDEWYNFHTSVRGRARVLLTLDEDSFVGGTMGEDHPFAWCHENLGGRAFYTAAGHTHESYAEEAFLGHLLGGIRYAARAA